MKILTYFTLMTYIILIVWVAVHEHHVKSVIPSDSNEQEQQLVNPSYAMTEKTTRSTYSARGCKYRN